MTHYAIAFLKLVSNDTGHETEAVQHVVEVLAEDPGAALSAAKRRFCAVENVGRWSDRADEIRIREVPPGLAAVGKRERVAV